MNIDGLPFTTVEKDYNCGNDIFSEPGILLILLNELNFEDRRLIILYAELNSLRAVAKIFNCSHVLLYYKVKRIRDYFEKRLKELNINRIILNDV